MMTALALPELWTELNFANSRKEICAAKVQDITDSCAKLHQKQHVTACQECYDKIVDALRARYRESGSREWFAQRRAFKQEIDEMFSETRERKLSLKNLEDRIDSEKEAWYRWMLRRHPDFLAVTEDGARQQELRDMLDDPDHSREVLIEEMWEAIGQPKIWAAKVVEFADGVRRTNGDINQLKELYIKEFFTDRHTNEPLPHSKLFLDDFKEGRASLEEIVDRIVKDIRKGRSLQPQRDAHQNRLEELRRAKMTFEQNRSRAKVRSSQVKGIGDKLYRPTRCFTCKNEVKLDTLLSCTVCQAISHTQSEKPLVFYCSELCYNKGHSDHVKQSHACSAGDECIMKSEGEGENDMTDAATEPVLCKFCLDKLEFTIYCSHRCANRDYSTHGKSHVGETQMEEKLPTANHTKPLTEVITSLLEKHSPGVTFTTI